MRITSLRYWFHSPTLCNSFDFPEEEIVEEQKEETEAEQKEEEGTEGEKQETEGEQEEKEKEDDEARKLLDIHFVQKCYTVLEAVINSLQFSTTLLVSASFIS